MIKIIIATIVFSLTVLVSMVIACTIIDFLDKSEKCMDKYLSDQPNDKRALIPPTKGDSHAE